MDQRTAVLFGATGLVGGHCLNLLLADDSYRQVTVFSRRPPAAQHPKLTVHIIDFDRLEEHGRRISGDDIFCCLGTTIKKAGSREAFRRVDLEYPRRVAELASRNRSRQFLLISALGADSGSKVFYNRVKGEAEKAVAKTPFSGIQIFRPSLLLGERAEFRFGEKAGELLMKIAAPFLRGRLKKYRPVQARCVAQAMVEIAKSDLPRLNFFESDQIQFFCDRLEKGTGNE